MGKQALFLREREREIEKQALDVHKLLTVKYKMIWLHIQEEGRYLQQKQSLS